MAAMSVGIIGMGDMGKMYARRLSEAGWKINACDIPSKYEDLKEQFDGTKNITILQNGHLVSRISDYIIYNVPAESIDKIVAEYGPSTKLGAIVGGQTSCKAPEIAAFEQHLPSDVQIVLCHSLHGPSVNPKGQPLVLIKHRATEETFKLVEKILSCLESRHVYLTWQEHDRITADTQAVTHAAFLSMGAAWAANQQFPWEISRYVGGIENVKINVMMRIFNNKWHVYAGLAIMNPSARDQIRQYAASVTELFKLMLLGQREEFSRRIKDAANKVFGASESNHRDLLLDDKLLDRFSLREKPAEPVKNSHLSLLAMVDCWAKLGVVPYNHMICSTPLFRMWLGITEYLFRTPSLLEETINTAMSDDLFRGDDLEFTFAARDWSERVNLRSFESYQEKFEKIQMYFGPRLPEAQRIGNEMIKTILEKTKKEEA
ncbi:Prephenate dehydrogenase [Venturia nashicola]|uniref:Prephenate dehydrogenase [NADP(+)] n=1 Tax=Venturia nashicola TaxID=86259 RepID=A0A4Z1P6R8_9PEZI|nr:Prephenate dehydrogenase [Venturia nashicola]